jgi:ABC-type transport system involved in Fe-S cluster assembly fused permease/ATPase subunit
VKDIESAPDLEVTRAEIEFQDVTFSYDLDKAPVLRGVYDCFPSLDCISLNSSLYFLCLIIGD